MDLFFLQKIRKLKSEIERDFDEYSPSSAITKLNIFVADLSTIYFECVKVLVLGGSWEFHDISETAYLISSSFDVGVCLSIFKKNTGFAICRGG